MKIIVTGGAGFIGSHITDRLVSDGHSVVVIDNLSAGKKENLNSRARFYEADIREPEIEEIFRKEMPDAVFHLAAQISVRESVKNPLFDADTNIIGSLNVVENFVKIYGRDPARLAAKKFIFFSTGGVMYGQTDILPSPETCPARPICPYGVCKLAVEKYLSCYRQTCGLPYAVLRLGNVYGPRQNAEGEAGVVAIFCGKMLGKKAPVINGDGGQTRDYVHVDDVVEAAARSLASEVSGIYNIGTGKETAVNEIFAKIKENLWPECPEIHGPDKPGDHRRGCLDASKANQDLGWQARRAVGEGLEETASWFKKKNEKSRRKINLTLAALWIFISLMLIFAGQKKAIFDLWDNFNLTPRPEGFTELYFNEYRILPLWMAKEALVEISFVIRNREGAAADYWWTVCLEPKDGQCEVFDQGKVPIPDGEYREIEISRGFDRLPDEGRIVVQLPGRNQRIDFLLRNE